MKTPNNGGPAFPVPEMHHGQDVKQVCDNVGMSLRAYIATAALPVAQSYQSQYAMEPNTQEIAACAVQIADALISELAKPTP
jgi:hypothetical protein